MHPFFWFILLPVGIIALWVCSLALAQADVKPPVLVDLHLEPAPIQLWPEKQFRVTAHFTDDVSGLYYAAIRFAPATGAVQNYQVEFSRNNRISGTATDGIYASWIELLPDSSAGPWIMVDLVMIDQAGHETQLGSAALLEHAQNSWVQHQASYLISGEESPEVTMPRTIAATGFDRPAIAPVI